MTRGGTATWKRYGVANSNACSRWSRNQEEISRSKAPVPWANTHKKSWLISGIRKFTTTWQRSVISRASRNCGARGKARRALARDAEGTSSGAILIPDADERRLGALRPFPTWPADGRSGRRPRGPPGRAGRRRAGPGPPRRGRRPALDSRGLVSKNSIFQGFNFQGLVPSRIRNWRVFKDSIFKDSISRIRIPEVRVLENSNPWNSVSKDLNSRAPPPDASGGTRRAGRWSLVGAACPCARAPAAGRGRGAGPGPGETRSNA